MNLTPEARKEIVHRLRRARGQIDGVISMMESDRPCRDVVTQLSAASGALDRAGYKLIASSMRNCLITDDADREMTPDELERLFITLA